MKEKDIPDSKLYPGHIRRLAVSLADNGMTSSEAISFILSAKGIDEHDKQAVARWFSENLPKLDEKFDSSSIKSIREECACCKGGERHKLAVAIKAQNEDLKHRLIALSKCNIIIGDSIEILSDNTFRVRFQPQGDYYRCSCFGFNKGDQQFEMPQSYCSCCGGHIKRHCETALGQKLEENMISSSLTSFGTKPCIFELKLAK